MSEQRKHPGDVLKSQFALERIKEDAFQFEQSKVEFLLKTFNMQKLKARLLRRARENGSEWLTLSAFNEEFPSFPFLLGTNLLGGTKLHISAACFVPSLYHRTEKAPFVKPYRDFYAANKRHAHGRSIGLILRRKGMPRGIIVHDGGLAGYEKPGMFAATYTGEEGTEPQQLFIHSFERLVKAIHDQGDGWSL